MATIRVSKLYDISLVDSTKIRRYIKLHPLLHGNTLTSPDYTTLYSLLDCVKDR